MHISTIKQSQLYFIFSFLSLIVFGTILLSTPFVMRNGVALHLIDALFTATSAVCVTGLATVPTNDFNFLGQITILTLIQLGGIGIMTLSSSILLFLGRNMSFGSTLIHSTINDSFSLRQTEGLLRTVTTYTLGIEAVGSVILSGAFWLGEGYDFSFLESVYLGIFHAISAFCNAGFSPFPNSLIGVSALVKITVAALIIFGGLGMYIIYDIAHCREHNHRLSINSRLVIMTSLILITGGTLGIMLCEKLSSPPDSITWLDAFFQSVSARTAGFNSIDLNRLSDSSITLIIVLMLIGAAPGSTGGGMKVTGVSLAVIAIFNTFMGHSKILLFKREIPISNILKSYTIIFTYIALTIVGALLLSVISTGTMQSSFFETASAIGTVGLSLGLTNELSTVGKLMLIFYMFIGRIGPFTMFLFLMSRESKSNLEYPIERVVIG